LLLERSGPDATLYTRTGGAMTVDLDSIRNAALSGRLLDARNTALSTRLFDAALPGLPR
jgi:hypothetical protein